MNAVALQQAVRLSTLFAGICPIDECDDRAVSDLTIDSRNATRGACFLALSGEQTQGMAHAADAVAHGAVAIVTERADNAREPLTIPVIELPTLRRYLGEIANRFFSNPSSHVRLFAVTGTNGKTTVAHLLAQALNSLGSGSGYIGTLGIGALEALRPTINTTPDVITINRELATLRASKLEACTLEASSHALTQARLDGLTLTAAIFTNLGHDHLDYHHNTAAYGAAKRRLFDECRPRAAVINIDDAFGRELAADWPQDSSLWTCSSVGPARVNASEVVSGDTGVSFIFCCEGHAAPIDSALVGRFNVDNLLLIGAALLAVGYEFDAVSACLGRLEGVPGRMELCGRRADGLRCFVDYAHTPDSLQAALKTLRALSPTKLHVVFGCGGDRDTSKRPMMGACAERLADHLYLTNDNSRSEDPMAIAADIAAGVADQSCLTVIIDRADAIGTALDEASGDDIVLVAGKGHETFQDIGGVKHPFSDRELVAKLCGGSPS